MLLSASGFAQTVSKPVFDPPSGASTPVVVTLTNANPNAITYFTLDGTMPDTNSVRYTGPLALTHYTVIRAKAFLAGQSPSGSVSGYYYPVKVAPTNSYIRTVATDLPATPLITVVISNAPNIACFTVEERLPTPLQATDISGGGVWNAGAGTVRWGPFSNAPLVVLSYRVAGLGGIYPLNGSESVDGQWTFDPGPTIVTIPPPATAVSTAPSVRTQTAMPLITPGTGGSVPTDVSLTCATSNAIIRFTIDGSMPNAQSAIFATALHFDAAATVIARAYAEGSIPSAAAVAYFGARVPPPDLQVTRKVDTDNPAEPGVTLTLVPGSTAHCYVVQEFLPAGLTAFDISADGIFTAGNGVIKWGPFFTNHTPALSYQAAGLPGVYPVHSVWSVDGVSGGDDPGTNLVIAVIAATNSVSPPPSREPQPVLTPASGASLPVTVAITNGDSQAQLRYTTDGSAPTTISPLYTGPLAFGQPTTLRVRAFGVNTDPSPQTVGYYGATVPLPDLRVSRSIDGSSPGAPVVVLAPALGRDLSNACYTVEEWLPAGAAAWNVTSGGVFNASNSVVRWGPFFGGTPPALSYQIAGLPGSYPLRATWSVNGVSDSETAGANVTIPVATPNFPSVPTSPAREPAPVLSPATGKGFPVTVAISCADPQAGIHFTLDGSPPLTSSPLYTGPLEIHSPATLRARSFRSGYLPSAGAVGYYTAANTNSLTLVRTVSGDATFLPVVNISAMPSYVQCYAVSETIAPGLRPYEIGENAIWDATNRVLKWGPFPDGKARQLTYKVSGPSTTYPLAGTGSFDGFPAPVTGATALRVDQTTVIYNGNTNDGFGGAIGNGRLVLSDDGTNVYGTIITSGPMDNALVLYIDSGSDGFSSTAGFGDTADPLRTAISGYTATAYNGGEGRSILTFEPGFTPGYALALQPANNVNFGGLWGLTNGGNQSLPLIANANLSPVGTGAAGTYRFSFNIANIGLTPGATQSFKFFGTFVADTGFRSSEAVAGNLTGVQGWNPFIQTAYSTYTMVSAVFPLIVVPPVGGEVAAGQTAQFAVTAIGAGPLEYQWRLSGTNLVDGPRVFGSTGNVLTISGVGMEDFGGYDVLVSNSFGAVTSSTAYLFMAGAPFSFSTGPGAFVYSNGRLYLQLTNPAGQGSFILEASTNLIQWTPILTNPAAFGTVQIIDSNAGLYSQRFYRTVTPGP